MFAYRAGKSVEIFKGKPLTSRKIKSLPIEAVEGILPIETPPLPGFGIYNPKDAANLGHILRSAQAFAIPFVYQVSGTVNWHKIKTDVTKATRWLITAEYDSIEHLRSEFPNVPIIGVEISSKSKNIKSFKPPRNSLFLFGREDEGIPQEILSKLDEIISIPTVVSLNVGITSAIVMFHWCSNFDFPNWSAKGRTYGA